MFWGTNILYSFSQKYYANVDNLNYIKAHPGDVGKGNIKLTSSSATNSPFLLRLFKKVGQLEVQGTCLRAGCGGYCIQLRFAGGAVR